MTFWSKAPMNSYLQAGLVQDASFTRVCDIILLKLHF